MQISHTSHTLPSICPLCHAPESGSHHGPHHPFSLIHLAHLCHCSGWTLGDLGAAWYILCTLKKLTYGYIWLKCGHGWSWSVLNGPDLSAISTSSWLWSRFPDVFRRWRQPQRGSAPAGRRSSCQSETPTWEMTVQKNAKQLGPAKKEWSQLTIFTIEYLIYSDISDGNGCRHGGYPDIPRMFCPWGNWPIEMLRS